MNSRDSEVPPLSLKKKLFLVGGAVGTVALIVLIMVVSIVITSPDGEDLSPEEMVDAALSDVPIIDGHNDFAWNLKEVLFNDLSKLNFSSNLSEVSPWKDRTWSQTDLPKLKAGRVGTMFWAALVDCMSQNKDAAMLAMEQIDVLKRLINEYKDDLQFSTESADIEDAQDNKKIASFISLAGGIAIQSSIALLRMYYDLGVRSLDLTHNCGTPWVESSSDAGNPGNIPINFGLTEFGSSVIEEMNRLGMIVDLSHVSKEGALSILKQSVAPVIFSHSGARALCDHHRNLDDETLKLVKEKEGLVMVGVYFHSDECNGGARATLEDVADHIDYIRNLTSVDNVGIGGHFDGTNLTAIGLENPSKYPDLFLYLAETGRWTTEDMKKLSGRNFLRVFQKVEEIRDTFSTTKGPIQKTITRAELTSHGVTFECLTTNYTDDHQGRKYL